jgi:hypothetical protein
LVSPIYRFAPYIVAAVLLLSALSRWQRARKIAQVERVNVSTASRMVALLGAILMCTLSVFWLWKLSPDRWVQVVAIAAFFGGLEQASLAAARGREWFLWQNRVFAAIFGLLAMLIVAAAIV